MSRRAQPTSNSTAARAGTTTNALPTNKKMPVESALKIMWNKISELDNEIKILKGESSSENRSSTRETTPEKSIFSKKTTTSNREQPTFASETELRNNYTQIKRVIEGQDRRIKQLETQFGRFTQEISKKTGTVKTELETKYSQLNNFLVELQTTQMVMNDKVLRQFNDVVEKNAEEKFRNASTQAHNDEHTADAEEQTADAEEQTTEQQTEAEQTTEQQTEAEQTTEQTTEQQTADAEEQTTEVEQTEENITLDVA
jgi:hypothetical protein